MIKSTKGDITQKVKTVTSGSEGGPYDIVLLTCKAYDLDSAIEAVAPAVGANTTVVPLLNGMRHLEALDARFGDGKVVGAWRASASQCRQRARSCTPARSPRSPSASATASPPRPALAELDAAIKKSGIDGGLNANIVQDLWDKWIMLCTLAATCCLMRGVVGRHPRSRRRAGDRAGDGRGGPQGGGRRRPRSRREGHPDHPLVPHVKGSRFTASMLHDLEKGAMVEADHIVGDMIVRAKKAGISTPNLRMAYAHLQVYLAAARTQRPRQAGVSRKGLNSEPDLPTSMA